MSKIIYDLTGNPNPRCILCSLIVYLTGAKEKIIVDLTEEEDLLTLMDLPVLDSESEDEADLLDLLDCFSPIASPVASPKKRLAASDFLSDSDDDMTPLKPARLNYSVINAYPMQEVSSEDDTMSVDSDLPPPFKDFDLEFTYVGALDQNIWENIPSNVNGWAWYKQDAHYVHVDPRLTTFEVCVWPYEYFGTNWEAVDVYCYDLNDIGGAEGYYFHVDLRCLRKTHFERSELVDYLANKVMELVREKSAVLRKQYKKPFRHVADCLAYDYTKHGCSPATACVLLNRDLALFLDTFN